MVKKGKSENVQVIVRVRPMNSKEKGRGEKEAVQLDLANNTITVEGEVGGGKVFAFDGVYNNSFSQKDVYLQSIHHVVETVLQGFNATIFAYGQSGTGKTYSMAGVLSDPKQLGIIPNALNHIFETINNLASDAMEYSVMASFVELYNGKCRDLLAEGRVNLELKENQQKQFYVKDLSHHPVKETMDAMKLMDAGLARREVKSTDLNADSSRSHSLFSVYVRTHDKVNDVRTESKLNLVDLAGSERQKASGASGETLTEGNNINQSLTALGMVIDCLVKNKPHIPYRSSPLTMLLKDGLGGNSRTVIVGTCSPSEGASHETVSSLRFLDRAKQIKNKPKVQMDPKDAKIAELQEEVKILKQRLGIDGDVEEGDGDGGGNDEARQNYIKSFDSEVEGLRRRVEELEVQAHLATDAEENARLELAQADNKLAHLRKEYEEKQRVLEEKIRRESEEQLLKNATTAQSNDELEDLLKLCSHFIEAHDGEKEWKHSKRLSVDDVANGFRMLDSGGFDKKVQASIVRRQSSVALSTSQSPPKPPAKPPSGPPPPQRAENRDLEAPGRAAASPSPTCESPALEGVKKPKKDKGAKDKGDKGDKKDKKDKKEKKKDATLEIGLLSRDEIKSLLAEAGVELSPVLESSIHELLDKQRAKMQEAMTERLKDASALETPEDAGQLLVAYEAQQEDLARLRAQVQKAKAASTKVKEIADRRAEEIEQHKGHIEELRRELGSKHEQHARELAQQQDQLVTQNNKRTEQLMQKQTKALIKEKKAREKLQEKIEEWEEKYGKLEQEYDVKIMEYEALQQNYEQQKLEQLKRYREMSNGYSALGGGGVRLDVTQSHDDSNERLRRAVAKQQAVALNTNFNPHANDNRYQSRSAPEPMDLPALGPGPSGANPFSRNLLDVQRR